ncbi:hypothetical protein [Spirillospora sp. NPDC047279]|uniref:hypothetical protein n=1 Tax=Spirillospora sp. NPDC047279 TaxID=3155478 RepID=UPI0033D6283E
MARCDTCGNEYDKTFTVTTHQGRTHTFDSIECAAHTIAPACEHCDCRVLGHGVEADGRFFCCASCAGQVGVQHVRA